MAGRNGLASTSAFADLVRDALATLYDTVHLQSHPLADLLVERALAPAGLDAASTRGRRLREEILETIESLRPAAGSSATLRHVILELRYVEGLDVAAITRRLAIGRTRYFDEQKQAVRALVSLLRQRWQPSIGSSGDADRPSPAPAPLAARAAARLPSPLTTMVGRDRSRAAVIDLLARTRLVTLTGPPGTGKTRLALAVAHALVGRSPDASSSELSFPDGVHYVALASIVEPEYVMPTIAAALGVPEAAGCSPSESLAAYLAERHLLLVLDNVERVVAVAPTLSRLLESCSGLRVLATSRAALRARGERDFPVPPLALPDATNLPSPEQLEEYEAIALFVDRARDVRPGFDLTDLNAAAVAEICARLDGLPLALELAAAWARVLSPEQIAARIGGRFALLSQELGDAASPHQRSLRATIDWSYALLSEANRITLRRAAVFAGGFTLEAAEAVISGDDIQTRDVLLLLSDLVDQSLIVPTYGADHVRYRLLETIAEYGQARLADAAEHALLRERHLQWCLALVERVPYESLDPEHVEEIAREHDNVRAAMQWALESSDAESAFRLVYGQLAYWYLRGHFSEGREWFEQASRLPGGRTVSVARCAALSAAADLAFCQADYARADEYLREARTIAESIGDDAGLATALNMSANLHTRRGQLIEAERLFHQARAMNQRLGRPGWDLMNMCGLLFTAFARQDVAAARAIAAEALAAARVHEHGHATRVVLRWLGAAEAEAGDRRRAGELLEESVALSREAGDLPAIALGLRALANLAALDDQPDRAGSLYLEGLRLSQACGRAVTIAECLEGLAGLCVGQESPHAAELLGASAAIRERAGSVPLPDERARIDRWIRCSSGTLGAESYALAEQRGRQMTTAAAIAIASSAMPQGSPSIA